MNSDGDGSTYGRSSKTYGSSSKLAYTRWMEQVCVCAYISILGMHSLYICMPHMYVHVLIHIHNNSKVHKTKLYMFEIQSYDYFKKVTIEKPSVLFHVLKTRRCAFWVNIKIFRPSKLSVLSLSGLFVNSWIYSCNEELYIYQTRVFFYAYSFIQFLFA